MRISVFTFIFLQYQLSFATQPPMEVFSDCKSHLIDETCDDSEDIAKVKAMNEFTENFEAVE
jgi:hypothetical protein